MEGPVLLWGGMLDDNKFTMTGANVPAVVLRSDLSRIVGGHYEVASGDAIVSGGWPEYVCYFPNSRTRFKTDDPTYGKDADGILDVLRFAAGTDYSTINFYWTLADDTPKTAHVHAPVAGIGAIHGDATGTVNFNVGADEGVIDISVVGGVPKNATFYATSKAARTVAISGVTSNTATIVDEDYITNVDLEIDPLRTRLNNLIEADGTSWRFKANALEEAPTGTTVTVSATTLGEAPIVNLVDYQYSIIGPHEITCTESQTGKAHVLLVYRHGHADDVLWSLSTSKISVGGVNGKTLTISDDDTNTDDAGTWHYQLRNTTDDKVICEGSYQIREAAEVPV
jgi:hypothetical protein